MSALRLLSNDEGLLNGDAFGKGRFECPRAQYCWSGQFDWLVINRVGRRWRAAIHGVMDGCPLLLIEGDFDWLWIIASGWRNRGGRQHLPSRDGSNPSLNQINAVAVQDLVREWRHFKSFECPHSDEGDGAPDVIRRDDGCVIDTFINQYWSLD